MGRLRMNGQIFKGIVSRHGRHVSFQHRTPWKIQLQFFHSAKNWWNLSLVWVRRLHRGELFLDLAICCLQINPNYFRGKKNTLQNIELGKVRYLKVWLFPTFARDGPCVTGEVGEQTKECHDSNLGANLSITTLPLLPLDKTQQKLRDVTHIGHYTCMCASVAIDMCGLSNPILCCLFLLQVNYIYVYFKKE